MSLFPLFLKLEGHPVLVVGGGEIAEGKISSLLHTGALVYVVAPEATAAIGGWAREQRIRWDQRSFAKEDVTGKQLVIAATSLADINHEVYAEARRQGVLCNVVDDPPYCDFYFPALVRRGELQIAISTGGQSPALAQQLRKHLEEQFGPEYADLVSQLGEQRRLILATLPAGEDRKKLLHKQAHQGLALASSENEKAKNIGEKRRTSKRVYLVGAGPGDPELLTVKAHNLLRSADVILHDDLVSQEILQLARPDATLINVGKRHGEKRITQEQIHVLLLHYAAQELTVVRLKGGDPMIFGRAAEEMQALEEAGIEFEIIPGVTAALAAAAAAQVSLTDRRSASTVVFTTSQHCAGRENMDWLRMARHDATLAIYMPGSDYEGLARELDAAGFSGEVPCMIVSGAATHAQQARRTTVSQLAKLPPLPAPSLVLVGETLAQRHQETSADVENIASCQGTDLSAPQKPQ